MTENPTDLAGAPEKRTGGPNLAAGGPRPTLVEKVAAALHARMVEIDLVVIDLKDWVITDATYHKTTWQKVLEYLAKGAIEEVESALEAKKQEIIQANLNRIVG